MKRLEGITEKSMSSVVEKDKFIRAPTPGVNFVNNLWATLRRADPKSAKKTVKLSAILCFWDVHS